MKYKLILYILKPNSFMVRTLESYHDNFEHLIDVYNTEKILLGDWLIDFKIIEVKGDVL